MASAPDSSAARIKASTLRYEWRAGALPRASASSASRTCSASSSASEYTATVVRSSSRQARTTRRAISPRFAIRTFFMSGGPPPGSPVAQRGDVLSGLDEVLVLDEEARDHSIAVGLDLVEGLHHLDKPDHLPAGDPVALVHVGVLVGAGATIEGAWHGRLDHRPVSHLRSSRLPVRRVGTRRARVP